MFGFEPTAFTWVKSSSNLEYKSSLCSLPHFIDMGYINPRHEYRLVELIVSSLAEKDLGMRSWKWTSNVHLHPKNTITPWIAWTEGGESDSLCCSHKTPSIALCPALEFPAQERCGPVGVGPEESHGDAQRTGTPLSWAQAESFGVVRCGKEKAPGRPP